MGGTELVEEFYKLKGLESYQGLKSLASGIPHKVAQAISSLRETSLRKIYLQVKEPKRSFLLDDLNLVFKAYSLPRACAPVFLNASFLFSQATLNGLQGATLGLQALSINPLLSPQTLYPSPHTHTHTRNIV